MQHSFSYEKNKVIQGVRYHFVQDRAIKLLVILINVFAVVSAVLFYSKKIRPEPFLLGSVLWLIMMVTFWYIMPHSIYKKAATFKDSFTILFTDMQVSLSNERGTVNWDWQKFSKFFAKFITKSDIKFSEPSIFIGKPKIMAITGFS